MPATGSLKDRFTKPVAEYQRLTHAGANPFRHGFADAQHPQELVGRDTLVMNSVDLLDSPQSSDQCTMFFGARGSGKTSTLAAIAGEARKKGWLVLELDGSGDGAGLINGLPGAIADAVSEHPHVAAEKEIAKENRYGLGKVYQHSRAKVAPEGWQRTPLRMLRDLAKKVQANKKVPGVLVTLDEMAAASEEECIHFGNSLQDIIKRKHLPVRFRGAALPEVRRGQLTHRDLSFFRRCTISPLIPITEASARGGYVRYAAMKDGAFTSDALALAGASIEGSPYMFQLVGHFAWEASAAPRSRITLDDVRRGAEEAGAVYRDRVEEATWRGLSDLQQDVLMHVLASPMILTRDELMQWLADEGVSKHRRRSAVANLMTDQVLTEHRSSGLVQVTTGSGLTPEFLGEQLAERERDPTDDPSRRDEISKSAGDSSEMCDKWMPRAKARCRLSRGHNGHCRS